MRLILFLFLLPSFGFAEDEIDLSYLKNLGDPDKLMVITMIDKECRTSEKEFESIVKGAMIRSRIKPTDEYTEPAISVKLECMEISNNNPVYVLTNRFLYFDQKKQMGVAYIKQYGGMGIGSKQSVETHVKDSVDKAMADYIQANFLTD